MTDNGSLFSISPLTPENAQEMYAVESQAHTHPWSLVSLEGCFGHLYRVLGIHQHNKLLGFAIVQQIVDEATLLDICVSPTSQGQGLGKKLLLQVLAEAKACDAVVMMLEVRESNIAAKSLYEALGFVESGRRKNYYPCELSVSAAGKEDAILMDYCWQD
ncbi:ribosomal-protein-alanine acetyltransferase [Shewanella sp. KT0246]|nr:ribosomal-protein-alanine acetyltransferase [Shewanella sp. KT0246]